MGDIVSLVFWESYESARVRPGMEGDAMLLGGEKLEVKPFMSGSPYDEWLEKELKVGRFLWREGSSLRRETFRPDESRACMLGRVAIAGT
jgi:hypothetical protein